MNRLVNHTSMSHFRQKKVMANTVLKIIIILVTVTVSMMTSDSGSESDSILSMLLEPTNSSSEELESELIKDSRNEDGRTIVKSKLGCPTVNRYRLAHKLSHLTIFSPNYPLQYPIRSSCRYHVMSPEGTRLFMTCKIALPHPLQKCPKTGDAFQYSLSGDETLTGKDSHRLCGHYLLKTYTSVNKLTIGFTSGPLNLWSFLPTTRNFKCKIKVIKGKGGSGSSVGSCGIRNGQRSSNLTSRIIGGMPAQVSEFPWRCALQVIKGGTVSKTCTCSIIHSDWILTSVHCTMNEKPEDIFIRVGVSTFSDMTTIGALPVSEVKQHMSYGAGLNDDVTVVKLAQPLVYSSSVAPICLPCPFKGQQFIENPMTVSGWVENPTGMQSLLYKDVQVMNRMICRSLLPINMDEICTYEPGKTDCMEMGDSGSYADYRDPATGLYYAAGIYSWNKVCMSQTMPAVQQNVARFIDWIETNTGQKIC